MKLVAMSKTNPMEIKYNTPIEVTSTQYNQLSKQCGGIVSFRQEAGKYYIKVLVMCYVRYVKEIL